MGLLRDRKTPYAPRRMGTPIDYAAMAKASAAARAEVMAANEVGRQNIAASNEFHMSPLNQLTERCHGIERQNAELAGIVGRLGEQVQTIISMLEANR